MSAQIDTGHRHSAVGQILGNYVIKAVLGEGGMGEVFLAEHQRLGRRVALKRLKGRFAKNRKAVKRFVDEAWAIGQIQHANIVKVTDFVLGEHDVYYIMELLEGTTLAAELQRSETLAPHRAVHVAGEVAAALNAVHAKGFVHGDIKPSNIFLVQNAQGQESVKLLDFGITTLKHSEPEEAGHEPSEAQLMTPVYMSPEQANRQPTAGSADLYSLGAVLYHMLAGAPPFEAATFAEYVYKHTEERPRPLRRAAPPDQRLSPELEQVVHRCLEKEPTARFTNAHLLRETLSKIPPQRAPGADARQFLLGSDLTGTISRLCVAAGAIALVVTLLTMGAKKADQAPTAHQPMDTVKPRPTPAGAGGQTRAPMPTPAPTPTSVTLRIESQPSRAVVRRLSPRPRILGLTPLTYTQDRSPERWMIEVSLPGFTPQRLQISLSGKVHRRVLLTPLATAPPATAPRPVVMAQPRPPPPMVVPRAVDPRGIIDPFNEGMR